MSRRRSWRALAPIAVAMLAALALAGAQLYIVPSESGGSVVAPARYLEQLQGEARYLQQLQSEVETRAGAPRPGRNPATRRQRSLAAAAAEPEGIGRRVRRPAARVRGDRSRRVAWASVFAGLAQRGLPASGCYADYGKPGEECVPAHAARRRVLKCEGVRMHFPGGVVVSGRDRFHLDRNRDGVACGPGD